MPDLLFNEKVKNDSLMLFLSCFHSNLPKSCPSSIYFTIYKLFTDMENEQNYICLIDTLNNVQILNSMI